MKWTDAIALESVGDNRFHAHVGEEWRALQGVHGGVVAALDVKAVEHVLRDAGVDPATTLRAATFGYVSGNAIGDVGIAPSRQPFSDMERWADEGQKLIEVAQAPTGIDDAVRNGLARAAKTVRHIDWFRSSRFVGQSPTEPLRRFRSR